MKKNVSVSTARFFGPFTGVFFLCLLLPAVVVLGQNAEEAGVRSMREVREKLEQLKRGIEKFEVEVDQLNDDGDHSALKPPTVQPRIDEGITLPTVNLYGNSGDEFPEELGESLPPGGGLKPYLSRFDGEQNPVVEEVRGQVSYYSEEFGTFTPVARGFKVEKPVLMLISADSYAVISFTGKIAARLGENTRIVVSPLQDGRYEVDLRVGTISALLDPNRDRNRDPAFAVRTHSGVTEATGTFYAVTEYKGQTYSAVKKGTVVKKIVPPTKPDFSAYLKQYKPKPKPSAKN